jgi:transposase
MVLYLSAGTRQRLDALVASTKDVRLLKRLLVLQWTDDGRARAEIVKLLGVKPRTIRQWLRLFRTRGLTGLVTLHCHGDPGNLTAAQIDHLKAEIHTGRFHCARQVCTYLKETFAVAYSLSGAKQLLHRIGCSFHQVSGFLFKGDRDKQEAHLHVFNEQTAEIQAGGTRRYFVDGWHPTYGMHDAFSCWLLRGQRFEMGVGGGRHRLNVLGALCPEDHDYLDIRIPKGSLNAQSVIALIDKIHTRHPTTKKFILYLDNARYQHAKLVAEHVEKLRQQGVVFVLKFLPPYSPNLNLIERLWKFVRKEALRCWHDTFEAMHAAVAQVLDNLSQFRNQLATLLTLKFHLVPRR